MDPKSSPRSGSQKVRFCCYLLHLSKVRRLRNGPHFGSCLKTSFAQNTTKNRKQRMPKNRCRKKVTLRKFGCLSEDPEAPWQPPRAPGTRNNLSNNSNNNSNSCSSCGSMLIFSARCWFVLLNVDFCFQNCPVWDETCKKRMLLIVRIQRLMIWHALGQGPANFTFHQFHFVAQRWLEIWETGNMGI